MDWGRCALVSLDKGKLEQGWWWNGLVLFLGHRRGLYRYHTLYRYHCSGGIWSTTSSWMYLRQSDTSITDFIISQTSACDKLIPSLLRKPSTSLSCMLSIKAILVSQCILMSSIATAVRASFFFAFLRQLFSYVISCFARILQAVFGICQLTLQTLFLRIIKMQANSLECIHAGRHGLC